MRRRRPKGSGRVRRLTSGRYRPTVVIDGHEVNPCDGETYATYEEASRVLDAANNVRQRGTYHERLDSLDVFGPPWLRRRKADGHRAWSTDQSRWKHIEAARFYTYPMSSITRTDVRDWLSDLRKKLASKSVRECLILLRCCLQAAVDDEVIGRNPIGDLKLKRKRHDAASALDDWTYLELHEQRAIELADAPEPLKLLVIFCYGSGLRAGEQMGLRVEDVVLEGVDPYVMVRRGSRRAKTTKTDRIRRVPLFGLALEAAKRWAEWRPLLCPTSPWFFGVPGQWFRRTWKGEPTGGLGLVLAAAGIPHRPHLNWKALRHTCGSALVSGMWGAPWDLIEVRDLLGHTTITMTQRYAHLAPTRLRAVADRTTHTGARGHETPSKSVKPRETVKLITRRSQVQILAAQPGPSAAESHQNSAARDDESGEGRAPVVPLCSLADEVLRLSELRDGRAVELGKELAERWLLSDPIASLALAALEGEALSHVSAMKLAHHLRRLEVAMDDNAKGGAR